ncbi:uncharacterized protein LOC124697248 [Lolium rigidum]|uniref:uncharacterized protein LOC124697248 n=1 Tax=Lolium rigidum TaxID=89674 RepID=UPI001F5E14BF|nr:uncharacterized protein LOC124697248 [Lolium rigidum]
MPMHLTDSTIGCVGDGVQQGGDATMRAHGPHAVRVLRHLTQAEREVARKERKGWSNPNLGAWLILRPACDGAWEPQGRLGCWRERGGPGSSEHLGYCFDLFVPDVDLSVPIADATIAASKGGKFALDLTTLGCSPRGSGDFSQWPHGHYRRFVMSAAVQGEGRCSKPAVEVGVVHTGCAEDAVAFMARVAAEDHLSMDASTRTQGHRHAGISPVTSGRDMSRATTCTQSSSSDMRSQGQRDRRWCGEERRETRESVPTCSYRETRPINSFTERPGVE